MAVSKSNEAKAKSTTEQLVELFQRDGEFVAYEEIASILKKPATATQVKKIQELAKKYKKTFLSSSELAKQLNYEEKILEKENKQKQINENLEDEFDLAKERESLEWSRSDSPVRMYLREMGQIQLLTKEEERELGKNIETGENIIIDAICSVPYLTDFIYNYRDALINRERRVKELFKNFEDKDSFDDGDSDENEDDEEKISEKTSSKDSERVKVIIAAFKELEKAKKER